MSTIGSDYSSHRRSVDELEQEFETAAKRAKEREQLREAKLERNLDAIVRKKDAELEKSVQTVRDEYSTSMKNQAKSDRVERDRLQQSLYDRSGRRSAAIEEAARTDRDRAIEAAAAAETRAARATAESERYQEQRATAQSERHEREMEALAESYRKQIAEVRGDGGEGEREQTRAYRKKLNDEAQAAIRQAREEVMTERRQAKALAEQTSFVLKDREKKSDALLNTRLHEQNLATKAELHRNAEAERASRERELQPLREQVLETAGIQRDAARAKNEARADAIRDLESDWNSKYANQSLSHELEKQKLQTDVADAERVYGEKLGSYMKETDTKTAAKIAAQNADHREQLQAATREYERSLEHVKLQATHEKENSEKLLARERDTATERRDRALASQSATYQDTLAKQRQAQQSQIQNLERILNQKNATNDPGEISAAAEQAVREAVSRQYEKKFQAEADRNAADREHLETNLRNRLSDAIADKHSTAANLNRENLKEQATMRSEFVQHVSDVEENKRQMLNLASDANAKMSESTLRNTERGMNGMRRHYEEIISTRDAEGANRLQEQRNQYEFEKRAIRREHSAKTADLIRSYEKKITETKLAGEEQNRDLKAKLDRITHETDKRLNQALADQGRGYERRISELEAQHEDRARTVAQRNEDELEKVKKANALLLSKKG